MQQFNDDVLKRTHHCEQLRIEDDGSDVRLCGWVRSYRDHGGVIFVDLRDREGITQVVFDTPEDPSDADQAARYELANTLRNEWVISIAGKVRPRGDERENPKLATGQIEVVCHDLVVLNKSETVPFEPDEFTEVSEDIRLKYRYIDLRRPQLANALRLRAKICRSIRDTLDDGGFIEVETPFLTKSTPEGARDFLVPSRIQQGDFYALPQSPQLFKQILMVGGLDKYYQIVRCFRDEDLRADRQPEFTQLDIEMSFVTQDDVMGISNNIMKNICELAGKSFPDEVPIIGYDEAVDRYGIDRPDMRFEMHLVDVGEIVGETDFKVFTGALDAGGIVKAICPTGGAKFTRKEIDAYTAHAAEYGAKGLAWCKIEADAFAGGVSKFLPEETQAKLRQAMGASEGDIIFFAADNSDTVHKVLAALRCKLGADLELFGKDDFKWCWVVDFPLVEWNPEQKRWTSLHHPFTAPTAGDMDKMESDPGAVKSVAYDLVLNGTELGGGSIRIHSPEVQKQVFKLLGISEEEAHVKFDFLLDALKYGAPPHGGVAFGLDRIVMMMVGGKSLRDVIAFPKTQRAICPLTNAPAAVDEAQLAELDIKLVAPPARAEKLE